MFSAALLLARFTGLLKRIPWWVYLVAALLAVWYIDRTRYGNMREYEARAEMQVKVDAEIAAHKATKATYRNAQAEAARLQDAKIAAEIARQERITDAVRQDYSRRLADSRANADRLRAQARGAGSGGAASGVPLPAVTEAAAGIDPKADCARLPAPSLEVDIACRAIATEQAIQLDALITWLEQQGEVP